MNLATFALLGTLLFLSTSPTAEDVPAMSIQDLAKGQADALFARFTTEMAAAVPREKNALLISNLKRDLGELTSSRVLHVTRNGPLTTHAYLLTFERGELLLTLTVDAQGKIAGMQFSPPAKEDPAATQYDAYETRSTLSPPFMGEWTAFHAARDSTNPHFTNPNQRFAVDWLMVGPDGKTHRGDGTRNQDYHCYGQDMLAPADGTVVLVVDGVPDNQPRTERDKYNVPGNQVVVDLGHGEFALFAHAIPGSITVKVGDKVKRGQVLGRVGNSGNSTEPHLHFQLSNHPQLFRARSLPAKFSNVTINGVVTSRAWPTSNDRMQGATLPASLQPGQATSSSRRM